MTDISSDKILAPTDATAQNVDAKYLRGRSDPRNFWAARPQKSGVAPARFSLFLRGNFLRDGVCKSLPINSVRRTPGEESGEEELKCVILTVFTLLTFFHHVFRTES